MFPLTPGTEYIYQGKIVEGGESKAHSVVFTVTGLTKVVGGVPTVVAWDRDFLEGKLQEQELALFAQDDRGNLWNFGEYPEEYENGKFTGAPDTWIRGAGGAYGGIHMLAKPTAGVRYTEGRIRSIGFYDLSRVVSTSQATCARRGFAGIPQPDSGQAPGPGRDGPGRGRGYGHGQARLPGQQAVPGHPARRSRARVTHAHLALVHGRSPASPSRNA
jgi:hypothetical protein